MGYPPAHRRNVLSEESNNYVAKRDACPVNAGSDLFVSGQNVSTKATTCGTSETQRKLAQGVAWLPRVKRREILKSRNVRQLWSVNQLVPFIGKRV